MKGKRMKATIKLGKFQLSELCDGKLWLLHESGEGMEISAAELLKLIDEYWTANF